MENSGKQPGNFGFHVFKIRLILSKIIRLQRALCHDEERAKQKKEEEEKEEDT